MSNKFVVSISAFLFLVIFSCHKNHKSYEPHLKMLEQYISGDLLDGIALMDSIEFLGKNKKKISLGPMMRLLALTNNPTIAQALLNALGDIGEKETVPAIIEYAERKPPLIRLQAIDAARRLPSKLSAEWLLVLAYGHDDEMVQIEAKRALEDVESFLKANNEL